MYSPFSQLRGWAGGSLPGRRRLFMSFLSLQPLIPLKEICHRPGVGLSADISAASPGPISFYLSKVYQILGEKFVKNYDQPVNLLWTIPLLAQKTLWKNEVSSLSG